MTRQKAISSALGCGLLIACFQLAPGIAAAEQDSDPRIVDIVRAGKLRVGIGLANLVSGVKDPATGELRGVAVDLGRALAARMKVQFQPVEYPRPGVVLEGARNNNWDVSFLVIDPARAADADFSAPYMESEFTLLVAADSPLRSFADADKKGIRIGVPRGDAVDLSLTRIVKQAELVRVDNQNAGADLLRTGQTNAYAAPRPALRGMAAQLSGSRVLDDAFASTSWAGFIPKGHGPRLAYVGEFLEEAKASGVVQQFVERAGLRGMKVAPRAKSN